MSRILKIISIVFISIYIFYLWGGQTNYRFESAKILHEINQYEEESIFLNDVLAEKKDSLKEMKVQIELMQEILINCDK